MKKKINVVYIGRRINEGKMCHAFMYGKREILFSRVRGYHEIGRTYKIEMEGEQYIFPRHGLEGTEEFKEGAHVEQWKIEDAIAENGYKALMARKKINNSPELFNSLNPIGELYSKAGLGRRVAIEVAVISWLREYIRIERRS